jgi:aldose sugar dehydrogenase
MARYWKILAAFVAVCVLLVLAGAVGMYVWGRSATRERTPVSLSTTTDVTQARVEEVAQGLEIPWSLAFTSPERMLVTERPGRLRVIDNGNLQTEPLHVFSEISTVGEEGLMALAIDPAYADNRYIYVSLAYEADQGMQVKVVRFRDDGESLSDETIIIDNIPAARFHAGCRIAFGPDGYLYISTGDATQKQLAQDVNSLAGKILRLHADGSVPADNPTPQSPVWSYGHRNPQGLAWDESGQLYATEHGPSIFDGPPGGDEFNKIISGGNYGWPMVSHGKLLDGTVPAAAVFTPAEAPASLMYYTGNILPQFTHQFFFGALVGKGIVNIQPNGQGFTAKKLYTDYGRVREVMQGPDGYIYFSTSNRDGRGQPQAGDDKIYRLVPVE